MKIKGPARSSEPATPPTEFGRWFCCQTCDLNKDPTKPQVGRMSAAEVKAHLREVHGINPPDGKIQGTRSGVIHADSWDSYLWLYLWKIGEVTLSETQCNPRRNPWQ